MTEQQKIHRDLQLVQNAYDAFDVPEEVRSYIWNTIASLCLYSAANQSGPFHDALQAAGFTVAPLGASAPNPQVISISKPRATKTTSGSRKKPIPSKKILSYADLADYLPAIGKGIEDAGESLHSARMHLSLLLSDQSHRNTITAADWPEAHALYDVIDNLIAGLQTLIPPTVRKPIEQQLGRELDLDFDTWII